MVDLPDPTSAEWAAAGLAAALVVVVLSLHLLRPVLARSPAAGWGRVAGFLLACVAAELVLVAAVAAVAGWQGGDDPGGPFAGLLVHADGATGTRVAAYVAALTLPAAAVLVVLSLGVVDVGRPSGLRIVAGVVVGIVLAVAALVVWGDTGAAPEAAAWFAVLLAGGAALALVADEVAGRRP